MEPCQCMLMRRGRKGAVGHGLPSQLSKGNVNIYYQTGLVFAVVFFLHVGLSVSVVCVEVVVPYAGYVRSVTNMYWMSTDYAVSSSCAGKCEGNSSPDPICGSTMAGLWQTSIVAAAWGNAAFGRRDRDRLGRSSGACAETLEREGSLTVITFLDALALLPRGEEISRSCLQSPAVACKTTNRNGIYRLGADWMQNRWIQIACLMHARDQACTKAARRL
ncbi:hypothetical protein B0T25DRAFT_30522 [Lasiosphaeria hispida]|uniref:Uncharacterized protein n=1 Tax=Lasiosphaeria hispida TaxID=260671 RepID=A0AAJ0HV36_9PEZI|nr:hypothetical protein B0T25DRAFT_30522 [Lasiosphaeria hispida]